MSPTEWTLIVALISISAGFLGSLVGVGGGIIIVPTLTLLMGVDIHHAIAASLVAVVATSSAAASTYVRERITNLRVGMLLETSTASGAVIGALAAGAASPRFLYTLFGCVLVWTGINMARKKVEHTHVMPEDALADRLRLHSSYYDRSLDKEVHYKVGRTRTALGISSIAGAVSGLLGVGGGVIKVPTMNLIMGMPLKAATATSNFMIGITAASGATVYLMRGDIKPFIAAPVAIGVIAGSKIGARLLGGMKIRSIQLIFVVLIAFAATQMLYRGIF